jgi:hypothetical protein
LDPHSGKIVKSLDEVTLPKNHEPDQTEESERAKYSDKVRHGVGIQLFPNKNPDGETVRYAGEWEKDQMVGDGHFIYADGSEYKGNFKNG